MEIHKPKAVHNWRELITEIGVVVVGILIALSLEQAVESYHRHQKYLEAREAVRSEIGNNLSNLAHRQSMLPCIKRRLAEIGALLDRAEGHGAIDPVNWVGDSYTLRIRYSAETDNGNSELFSSGEQRQYGLIYAWLHAVDLEQTNERLAWAHLQALEGRSTVPPEMINSLRMTLADARYENDRIRFLVEWLRVGARQAGIQPVDNPDMLSIIPKVWPQCISMSTPREDALQQTKWFIEKY